MARRIWTDYACATFPLFHKKLSQALSPKVLLGLLQNDREGADRLASQLPGFREKIEKLGGLEILRQGQSLEFLDMEGRVTHRWRDRSVPDILAGLKKDAGSKP